MECFCHSYKKETSKWGWRSFFFWVWWLLLWMGVLPKQGVALRRGVQVAIKCLYTVQEWLANPKSEPQTLWCGKINPNLWQNLDNFSGSTCLDLGFCSKFSASAASMCQHIRAICPVLCCKYCESIGTSQTCPGCAASGCGKILDPINLLP